MPTQSTSLWKNIFGIQVEGVGEYNTSPEARIPSIWIRQGLANVMISIEYVTANYYHITTKFNTGNWINLKISQIGGITTIKVDNQLVNKQINSNPQKWANVKVVMGNVYGRNDWLPAEGEFRNFEINNFPSSSKSLQWVSTLECS